jgi:multiple sugar transport system substrate-binding protein
MSAKTSLFLLLCFVIALGIMRCDRASSLTGRDVVQLSFWNGFTGPDGRVMLEMIRRFNNENPDVHVSMQRIAWATYYNKLMVSAIDGRGPEVFVLQAQLLPRMDRAAFIEDVTSMYTTSLREDIDPTIIARMNFPLADGRERLIGLPLDIWPRGMYCNAEMLKSIGMVNTDGSARAPTNFDEFIKAVTELKKDFDGDGSIDQWGWGFGPWNDNFMSLVPQFGGQYLDADGQPTLDHPGNIAALQFLVDLLQKYKVAPPPEGGIAGWIGFRQKRVAMVWEGPYMLGDLKRLTDHPYFGVPLPQVGPKQGTLADSHVLCVRKGLDEKTQSAAMRFMKFISDNSLDWADAGQVPIRKSVLASDGFKKLQVQYAFSKQLPYVMYPPRTPSLNQLQLNINLACESAIRGNMSAAAALKKANEDYKRYLERDRVEQQTDGVGEEQHSTIDDAKRGVSFIYSSPNSGESVRGVRLADGRNALIAHDQMPQPLDWVRQGSSSSRGSFSDRRISGHGEQESSYDGPGRMNPARVVSTCFASRRPEILHSLRLALDDGDVGSGVLGLEGGVA